ncbi:MAG: tetratricopeptide repeat protein [Bacteroidota bacterium]
MTKQTVTTVVEIPITTTSASARQHYIVGRLLGENFQTQKAAAAFKNAVDADPDFALGYMGLATASNKFSDQTAYFDKAEDLAKNASEGERHLIRLTRAMYENVYPVMKSEVQSLLSMFPKDKRVLLNAALFENYFNSNTEASMRHTNKALELDPDFAAAYNNLGYLYIDKGDFKKAETAFKKYISLQPGFPNAHDSYAEMLMKAGRYDESIAEYNKALSLDPKFIIAYTGLGNNYLFKGDFVKARENYQKMCDADPNGYMNLTGLYNQAVSFVREGDFDNALKVLDKRVSAAQTIGSVSDVVLSHTIAAQILAAKGNADEAMKHYDMAYEDIEKSALAGNIKDDMNRQVKLHRLNSKAISDQTYAVNAELETIEQLVGGIQNPRDKSEYELVSGIAAMKENRDDKAMVHFSADCSRDPMSWYYQSVIYNKKGNTRKAEQMKEKIRKSTDNSFDLALAYNLITRDVSKDK